MGDEQGLRPFTIAVPDAALDDLADRLARTRFTRELPIEPGAPADAHGVTRRRVEALVARWRDGYDWRAWEARLAALPQLTTRIDGLDVHLLHVRSPEPAAFPLVLTHGWPLSVAEWLDVIGPLTDPAAHGGEGRDAFHVVAPSLPGFGFSGPPPTPGWGSHRTAQAWAELMARLGYDRYGAHGNDVGGVVSIALGRVAPEHVAGVHVTQVFSLPSERDGPAEVAALDAGDRARLDRALRFVGERGAYLRLQATQPQTLAHALADSPAGLLGWYLQLFGDGDDGSTDTGNHVDPDYALTHATIHWLTNCAGTAATAAYFDDAHGPRPAGPSTVPLGVSTFAGDVFPSVRGLAERDHAAIVSWRDHADGGHHPAHQAPAALVEDIRALFRGLR